MGPCFVLPKPQAALSPRVYLFLFCFWTFPCASHVTFSHAFLLTLWMSPLVSSRSSVTCFPPGRFPQRSYSHHPKDWSAPLSHSIPIFPLDETSSAALQRPVPLLPRPAPPLELTFLESCCQPLGARPPGHSLPLPCQSLLAHSES